MFDSLDVLKYCYERLNLCLNLLCMQVALVKTSGTYLDEC